MPTREAPLDHVVKAFAQKRKELSPDVMKTPFDDLDPARLKTYLSCVTAGIYRSPNKADVEFDLILPQSPPMTECRIFRDVDSIIVVSKELPWTATLDMISNPKHIQPIGDLHARVKFDATEAGGEEIFRDPGEDNAMHWAQCGSSGRYSVYLMLPQLQGDDDALEKAQDYIYSSATKWIKEWAPEMAPGRLPGRGDEERRERGFGHSGRATASRKVLSAQNAKDLAADIIWALEREAWGQHAYWLLQIHGAKDGTRHPVDVSSISSVIDDLLEHVDRDDCYIFVDVAIEIHAENPAFGVLPLRAGHPKLLTDILGIPEEHTGTTQLDVWGGISMVAGARWNFADNPVTPNQISYMQLYVTDKAALYNASLKNRMPVLTTMAPLKLTDPNQEIPFMQKVYSTLHSAATNGMPIATRLEVRVPISRATRVFTPARLNHAQYNGVVHVLPLNTIWGWRLERMMALAVLFRASAAQPPKLRVSLDHLKLVATTVYMWNSLITSPPAWRNERKLCRIVWDTSSSLANRELVTEIGFFTPPSQKSEVPLLQRGAMWLPTLQWPEPGTTNIFRLAYSPGILDRDETAALFGIAWGNLETLFDTFKTVARGEAGLLRRNVKGSTPIERREEELPGSFVVTPDETPYDHGDDMAVDAHYGSIPNDEDLNVSQVFQDVLAEVFQLVGISQAGTFSYCTLTRDQRGCVGPATFQDRNLLTYFPRGYVTNALQQWERTRNLLFPGLHSRPNYGKQGWAGVAAHRRYLDLIGGTDRKQATAVHKFCTDQFSKLSWYPLLVADKMLDYRPKKGGEFTPFGDFPPLDAKGVSVVWNPKARDGPVLAPVARANSRPTLDDQGLAQWRQRQPADGQTVDILNQRLPRPAPALVAHLERGTRVMRGRVMHGDDDEPEPAGVVHPRYEEEEESSDMEH
ncbi:hypothetical protein C8F04DRAFT_1257535 [Mycena alexandri]|uniref:Uncharacterized protein n=1 Tax=Mycena alexandri TaxID=1745969 RepID=A0AAD6T0P7_9AGAR|nr:hypothetical protein C8F04DRAFT_1257535 [Mycena alexandri]